VGTNIAEAIQVAQLFPRFVEEDDNTGFDGGFIGGGT